MKIGVFFFYISTIFIHIFVFNHLLMNINKRLQLLMKNIKKKSWLAIFLKMFVCAQLKIWLTCF